MTHHDDPSHPIPSHAMTHRCECNAGVRGRMLNRLRAPASSPYLSFGGSCCGYRYRYRLA